MKFKQFKDLDKEQKYSYLKLYLIISLFFNLILLGGTLNQVAMKLNDNRMPVLMASDQGYLEDNTHLLINSPKEANFSLLSDRFNIGNATYSIGDLIIYIGAFLIVIFCIKLIVLDFKIRRIR